MYTKPKTIKFCQYCADPVLKAGTTPFATCDRCKAQRAAILRAYRADKRFQWVCKCRSRHKSSDPYCERCLMLRKDGRRILKSRKTIPYITVKAEPPKKKRPKGQTDHRCNCSWYKGSFVVNPKCKQHGT